MLLHAAYSRVCRLNDIEKPRSRNGTRLLQPVGNSRRYEHRIRTSNLNIRIGANLLSHRMHSSNANKRKFVSGMKRTGDTGDALLTGFNVIFECSRTGDALFRPESRHSEHPGVNNGSCVRSSAQNTDFNTNNGFCVRAVALPMEAVRFKLCDVELRLFSRQPKPRSPIRDEASSSSPADGRGRG